MTSGPMSPAEYAAHLAAEAEPLTDAQVEAAARILASVDVDEQHTRVA